MTGNPGLLQELPDIAALLPEGGGDGEQVAAADRTLAGLVAMADIALNHRLAQGTLSSVVGGLDSTGLQKGPKTIGLLQDLLAGAHRLGPRRSLTPLVANAAPEWQSRSLGWRNTELVVACPLAELVRKHFKHAIWCFSD